MPLEKEHIEHLANLAKLGVNEDEKEKYAEQISSILDYFEQLKELDTKGVEPLAQVTNLKTVVRDDEVKVAFNKDKVMAEAPEIDKKQVKVKPVMNN